MPRRKEDPLGQLIGGIVVLIVLFYVFVWPPLVAWWQVNGWIVLTVLGVSGASLLGWFIYSRVRPSSIHASPTVVAPNHDTPLHQFESNTTISYDKYLEHQKKAKINEVKDMIESFKPFKSYRFESDYHIGLAHHLKTKYPETRIEVQKSSSRPDITIGKIAIEVKGPTTSQGLDSIASKIMRYRNNFEDGLIIVLFNIQVSEGYYVEWETGIKKHGLTLR